MKKHNNLEDRIKSLFEFKNDEQKFEFEKLVLQTEFMLFIADLMKKSGIENRAQLAAKLDISESMVSQLFSGDKSINMDILTKLQRIFDIRFRLADATGLMLQIKNQ